MLLCLIFLKSRKSLCFRVSAKKSALEKSENQDECHETKERTGKEESEEKTSDWDQEKLHSLSRKFNIDLVPKVNYFECFCTAQF